MYCIVATGRIPFIVTKIEENMDDEQKKVRKKLPKNTKKSKKKSKKKVSSENGETLYISKL